MQVASITEDLKKCLPTPVLTSLKPGREGLMQLLDSRNVRAVPFSDWEKIDSEEKRLGSLRNKPRDKLTSWQDLLKVASQ